MGEIVSLYQDSRDPTGLTLCGLIPQAYRSDLSGTPVTHLIDFAEIKQP